CRRRSSPLAHPHLRATPLASTSSSSSSGLGWKPGRNTSVSDSTSVSSIASCLLRRRLIVMAKPPLNSTCIALPSDQVLNELRERDRCDHADDGHEDDECDTCNGGHDHPQPARIHEADELQEQEAEAEHASDVRHGHDEPSLGRLGLLVELLLGHDFPCAFSRLIS